MVAKYDLTEVEIDLGEMHVRVARDRDRRRSQNFAAAVADCGDRACLRRRLPPRRSAVPAADELAGAVKSPMVGTAYLRPNPEAKPFVEVGSLVKAGDKLLLVEAMKTFNDIVAPRAGKVVSILVEDGSPVEYGQPLMVIE